MLRHPLTLALVCIFSLPFFNFARYSPLQDWWTNALTLGFISSGLLIAAWRLRGQSDHHVQTVWFLPAFLLWWLLLWVGSLLRYQQQQAGMLPFELFGLLLAALGAVLLANEQPRIGRSQLVTAMAWSILLGAVVQALIGVSQMAGLAPQSNGWLLSSGMEIMGNIGQRNQFAHVLTWGMLATAYLYSQRRLPAWLTITLCLYLSLLSAWSGGRLPLAYAVTIAVLGVLMRMRLPQSGIGKALLWAAASILLFQFSGKHLAQWLFSVDIGSGLDRLNDAGFGARRRVEWDKCWQIVSAYPWLGTGIGGYAYQSVWLEAFGGYGRVPESSLFTHSHNLVTQLLAETGVPATLLAAAIVSYCLWPYLKRENASPENAFLLGMVAVTLGHSIFEYPLWYLPFSFAFFTILALSPRPPLTLALRASMRRIGALILGVAGLLYVLHGASVFGLLTDSQQPSRDVKVNQQRIEQLIALSANPFWRFEAELMLSNYLVPTTQQLAIKLQHHEALVAYRPYPTLLCKTAIMQQWSGRSQAAEDRLRMLLAAYPNMAANCALMIASRNDARLQGLLRTVSKAALTLQQQGEGAVAAQAVTGVALRPPLLPRFN
ncbi:Wzy polymerase domain-containing protein [Vogesella sp. DC21W]|uniref:Wzy polymerase domain-containing protein n=1 Tax=Vogesella aquatica TaxID=2984206 RepID=A0ABT5IV57_9NEIS|nr:Wzy polymerase domain-containing protein [Vogesella aquatica]MDC7716402.1 Wzy polymerase domain-containing protein [Vogesella aquatica]